MNNKARRRRIAHHLESWFAKDQRPLPWRDRYDPYEVWISEVMLQQTRMEVVLLHYARFLERFPTMTSLAAAREQDVLAAWSGLGYYRRARMLHRAATEIAGRFGGVMPSDVDTLRTIPGIGRYTAGAICSIAYEKRTPIVDGNVKRVLSRLEAIEEPAGSAALSATHWHIAEELVNASDSPRNFNQALMEHGARVCKPRNPLCELCSLAKLCQARRRGEVARFPLPRQRRAATPLTISLFFVRDSHGRVLMRKELGPLMGGMYHLPHGESALLPGGARFDRDRLLGRFRHTITHRRIVFELYAASAPSEVREDGGEYEWIDPRAIDSIPHPSYVKKALALTTNND